MKSIGAKILILTSFVSLTPVCLLGTFAYVSSSAMSGEYSLEAGNILLSSLTRDIGDYFDSRVKALKTAAAENIASAAEETGRTAEELVTAIEKFKT